MVLSIVIPVYNVEKYVEQCLRSCAEQNVLSSEYEIVVVNDGSTDNSLQIVEQVAKDYSNIHIISQPNGGLSAARNTGISHAEGDYLWFVDSDDWLSENCLQTIFDTLTVGDLDALRLSTIRIENGISLEVVQEKGVGYIMSGVDYLMNYNLNCASVRTILKRSLLVDNNLFFCEGIYHEDHEFTPRVYFYINRLRVIDYHVYMNRLTPGSITQMINPKKAFDLLVVAERLAEFTISHKFRGLLKKKYCNLISSAINQALYNSLNMDRKNKIEFSKRLSSKRFLLRLMQNSTNKVYAIEGILFSSFPRLVTQLYSIRRFFE